MKRVPILAIAMSLIISSPLLAFPIAVTTNSGGNAGAVATAFDLLDPSDPDVAFLDNFLSFATDPQLQCDFDQMHTAMFNAIPIADEMATLAIRASLSDRLEEVHGPLCERESFEEMCMGFWLAPIANFNKQNSRSQHGECDQTKVGFNVDTYGITAGWDGAWSDYFVLGGALSYAHTHVSWKESLAHASMNNGYASLFGTLYNRIAYLDVAVIGAYNHCSAERTIRLQNIFTKIKRKADHDNHAGQLDTHLGFGFTWNPANHDGVFCYQLRPFANLDYLIVHESGYTESGAKSIDLDVKWKNSDLIREEIGLSFVTWRLGTCVEWSQELSLSYVHEDRIRGKHSKEHFVDSDHEFEVHGFLPDRDLVAPGGGIRLFFPAKNISLALRYAGEFGDEWKNQTGSAELLWSF